MMGLDLDYGIVTALDYRACRVRVRLDDRDGLETYWLDVPQRNSQGTKRRPVLYEIGEQVAVLLREDGVGGVVLGGVYSTVEPPPVADHDTDYVRFRDGTTITYHQGAHLLRVECVGDVQLQAKNVQATAETVNVQASQVAIKAESAAISATQSTIEGGVGVTGQVKIKGNLDVDGNIHASGTIIDELGNTNHHRH
ncbi:phage baseplate assembly protein V [Kerstersia gyiorum]|uniref:phage baseplate assembly protein V n=1 Tax=Kerstersia gyiorum TaxID=206506 RepID=UPI0039EB4484